MSDRDILRKMSRLVPVLAVVTVLCAGTALAQMQGGTNQIPQDTNQIPQELRNVLSDALERAEAERQRQEQERWERESEAERNRVHTYHITCRVTQIITTPTDLRISCDEVQNRRFNDGRIYSGDEYTGRHPTAYVDLAANPAFAAVAAEVASISFADRLRLRMEANTRPRERQLWLTQISIDRGEGCSPACPP